MYSGSPSVLFISIDIIHTIFCGSIILLFLPNNSCIPTQKENYIAKTISILFIYLFIITTNINSNAYASENGCIISGEVLDVRLGSHDFKSNNRDQSNKISFTELIIKINSTETPSEQFFNANCKKIRQQKTINVGLCEEQTIIVGDIIKGDTGGWENGPDCIIDVKFIFKAERKKTEEDD